MQIVVSTRAQIDRLNQWEQDINKKFVSYEYGKIHREIEKEFQKQNPNLTIKGNSLSGLWQLGIRPIRFYQIAFPEPMMDRVLSMIAPGKPWSKSMDKFLWPMRKSLGLEKIPDWKPQIREDLKNPGEYLDKTSVECVGIGLKKDRYENGIEQV